MFFAGPAFMAGRYGVGCGIVFKGGRKATFMKADITPMANFAKKIAKGEELLPAAQEGYFPRGIRSEIPEPNGIMAADRVYRYAHQEAQRRAESCLWTTPTESRVQVLRSGASTTSPSWIIFQRECSRPYTQDLTQRNVY